VKCRKSSIASEVNCRGIRRIKRKDLGVEIAYRCASKCPLAALWREGCGQFCFRHAIIHLFEINIDNNLLNKKILVDNLIEKACFSMKRVYFTSLWCDDEQRH
jgi:hypothetical protein